MISSEDSLTTYEYNSYFKILPQIYDWYTNKRRIKKGKKVKEGFIYSSDTNLEWMKVNELRTFIKKFLLN